jgi:hypothetical protein
MTDSNEVNIVIPGGRSGIIVCQSHASFYQKVNIHYLIQGRKRYFGDIGFYGRGEDVAMITEDGQKAILIPIPDTPEDEKIELTISFYYNPTKP